MKLLEERRLRDSRRRPKGGEKLMQIAKRSKAEQEAPPVVEEVTTVKRYTESDRFKPRLAEMVGEFDADQSIPAPTAPPAPGRDDLIGGMFPRLTAAADLLGKIRDNVQDKYTKAELKKLDEDVLSGTLDDVMVKQLSDIESLLSGGNLEKNLPTVRARIDKQKVRNDVIAQKDLNAVEEALRAKEREKVMEEVKKPLPDIKEEAFDALVAAQEPVEAFSDTELEGLIRGSLRVAPSGEVVEMPTKEQLDMLKDLAKTYEKFAGVKRTPLQLWVSIYHPDMDEAFTEYLMTEFQDAEATEE